MPAKTIYHRLFYLPLPHGYGTERMRAAALENLPLLMTVVLQPTASKGGKELCQTM